MFWPAVWPNRRFWIWFSFNSAECCDKMICLCHSYPEDSFAKHKQTVIIEGLSCQHNKLHLPDLAEQLIRHSRQFMCFCRAVWMNLKLKACMSGKFIRYARYAIAHIWSNATWKWMQCLLYQNYAFLANDITLLWDACNWTPPLYVLQGYNLNLSFCQYILFQESTHLIWGLQSSFSHY